MAKEAHFGTDNIGKLLLQQSIPAALGILVLSVYSLVDTVFIGRYIGAIGIAAITIVSPISFLVSSIGLGIGMGGGSLISIKIGENDQKKARQVIAHQLWMTLIISVCIYIVGFLFYEPILKGFGAQGDSLIASNEYFYYTLIGLPFFMGQMVVNNLLRAEGNAKSAMLVLGIPSMLNIALDAWFIVSLNMGLTGAALATAISQCSGMLLGILLMVRQSDILPQLEDFKLRSSVFSAISTLGSVQFFSQASMSVVVLFSNHLLMKYGGDLAISAYGLVIRIVMFAFFPVLGIVQGFMPIAGYNYGAGLHARVKEIIKTSFFSSTVIACLIMLIAMFFTQSIIELFTEESELISLSVIVMFWVFCAYPLLGIQQISTSYFQAIGKAKPALWLTLTKQIILIPTMFVLPFWFALDGMWYSFPVSEVSTTGIAYYFFQRELKQPTQ